MCVRLQSMLAMLPANLKRLLPAWRHAGTHLPEQSLQPLRRPQLQLLHNKLDASAHEAAGKQAKRVKAGRETEHGP